jgi:threonine dehydratase
VEAEAVEHALCIMNRDNHVTDLSPERIASAAERIDQAFLQTPQFVSDALSAALHREAVVKDETVTPIGSFKGRGTWLLAEKLDPVKTWVCSTAGNFGQGLTYAARARGAAVEAFVSAEVPAAKVAGMRALGARVHITEQPGRAAEVYAAASEDRLLVVDGLRPEMAEGAGTIALELESLGPIDLALVQIGDGALASGIGCWLKHARPRTRIVGVCASGAPAMARSFAAGHVVSTSDTDTIATAIAISEPVPESLARVITLVDEIVLVDDDDLRRAQKLILDAVGVAVEPAGAAGVAALARHGRDFDARRAAVFLTGAGTPAPND